MLNYVNSKLKTSWLLLSCLYRDKLRFATFLAEIFMACPYYSRLAVKRRIIKGHTLSFFRQVLIRTNKFRHVDSILLLLIFLPLSFSLAGSLDTFNHYNAAGLLYQDEAGKAINTKRAEDLFVPASTTKLVTAYLALNHWGEDHRFKTEFYLDEATANATLWIKGFGDPFLVSEELQIIASIIAARLKAKGICKLAGIRLDTTYFASNVKLPGTGKSNNPYDAIPSALAANFNTVSALKKNGVIVSAEEQTPVTNTARYIYRTMHAGSERVNTGSDPRIAERYFGELVAEFLRREMIAVGNEVTWGEVPSTIPLMYQHLNSRTLADVIKPMMKYSTNFIANQLVLKLSAEQQGAPANSDKVRQTLKGMLPTEFGWRDYFLEDGAGLSRNNRLSPAQLVDVLDRFRSWKHLLPEIEPGIYAKSGSLIGVSALAGYINKHDEWRPFAVIINQQTPYQFRNKLAVELSKQADRVLH
ncbi:MAG: peptidase S13 [Gammaproteobacteria bacterium]|nr:MAG: peptidase S13 [Gammaproteobacteria bacterium]RLA42809.1 MAG: peptidase S13 [Gammaproteobacteria bacterium]